MQTLQNLFLLLEGVNGHFTSKLLSLQLIPEKILAQRFAALLPCFQSLYTLTLQPQLAPICISWGPGCSLDLARAHVTAPFWPSCFQRCCETPLSTCFQRGGLPPGSSPVVLHSLFIFCSPDLTAAVLLVEIQRTDVWASFRRTERLL